VFPIETPPLRERIEDLPLLVETIVSRNIRAGREGIRFSPGAIVTLASYPWPGNVRELANLVERLAILHPNGIVEPTDLPARYRGSDVEAEAAVLFGPREAADAHVLLEHHDRHAARGELVRRRESRGASADDDNRGGVQ